MIPLGRQICRACAGSGRSTSDTWIECVPCEGTGHHWRVGGPRFGARLELADGAVGDTVTLATGDRALITAQMPKKNPTATRVRLIDDFTDEYDEPQTADSSLGVVSIASRGLRGADDGAGTKDADAVDPLAQRGRGGDSI